MRNRNYCLKKRKKSKAIKDFSHFFNNYMHIYCNKCNCFIFIYMEGMEREISGLKCENCGEIYPLTEFLIENEEEVKKEIKRHYFINHGFELIDPQKEYNRRLLEASFTGDKQVFTDDFVLREDRL